MNTQLTEAVNLAGADGTYYGLLVVALSITLVIPLANYLEERRTA